jgi:acyl carrier protein phosphodiesterase
MAVFATPDQKAALMNRLAHALLSPLPPAAAAGVLVGHLTADWIKGRARLALPVDFRAGFALHRRIDAFTDTHGLVERCSGLLADRWQRYAPVLVDIFFDHVLSCEWPRYSAVPHAEFISTTYAMLRAHLHLLPPRAQYATNALLADDWFSCYATLDGIALSLSRLSNRLRERGWQDVELATSVSDFCAHRPAFDEAFRDFFPELRRFVETAPQIEVH